MTSNPSINLWLDLWEGGEGDEGGLNLDERTALAAAGAMLGVALRSGSTPSPRPA